MATHGENAAMVVAPAGPGLAKATGGGFSRDQRDLILQTCCGGATESEARVLIAIAEARGLNPLLQECYFVKRYDKDKRREVWAVQAAIDSFRIKAEETGDYAGQDEPEYEYEPGGKHLKLARVRVYRKSVPGR
ncbi:MAG TPA: recombinase RecT, partial [Terriglobales bacterium]|nr:recombinase RecT [Terriglobales bacterium]